MVKVSVILPVYGVAAYIERCVNSLLDQTLQELEFLFVDDHGPDDSVARLKAKIAGHPRESQFRILVPEHNLGAGMARNYAIPEAKGEYIAFVDSDDYIDSDMFERLYQAAKGVDICYSHAYKDYTDGHPTEILRNPMVADGSFDGEKKAYFLTHYVSLFWTFLYKREMVMKYDVRFSPDRSADDTYFETCALLVAQSVASVDAPFYHYLIRPGSVCSTKDSDKYLKRLATFERLVDYAKQKNVYEPNKAAFDFLYIKKGYLSTLMNYVMNSLEPKREVYEAIYQQMVRLIPDYAENSHLKHSLPHRILIFLFRHCPKLATPLLRQYIVKTHAVA